jgi:hypothetical protein
MYNQEWGKPMPIILPKSSSDLRPKKGFLGKFFEYSLLFLIFILIALAAFFFLVKYGQNKVSLKQLASSQKTSNQGVGQLVSAVGKLMELPQETPIAATISDITKLKNQPFFTNAQNGDRVLVFTQAKKAILYRPSNNKIINVSSLSFSPTSPTPTITEVSPIPSSSSPKLEPSPSPKIQ